MFKVSGLSKSFGSTPVLRSVSFVVNAGERLGVVGANGSGKSTLLRIVAGEETADAGAVDTQHASAGYLRQGHAGDGGRACGDVFPHAFAGVLAQARLEEAATAIAGDADASAYEAALAAVEAASPSAEVARDAWAGLRLRHIAPEERLDALSGGEQTKLGLVDLVAAATDALLLDEPTNNLDLDALEWLDAYLRAFRGAALIVSHDRALLNDHATSILELDGASHSATIFAGDYDAYAAEKARRVDEAWARYRREHEHERRVKQEVRQIKQSAQRKESVSQNDFYRRKAKKVARRAVVLERRLERELTSGERAEKPVARPYRVKAEFEATGRAGDRMVAASGLRASAGGTLLFDGVALTIGWGERVVIVGPNGGGKTTLLRTLIGKQAPDAGTVTTSPSTRVGYLPQNETPDADSSGADSPVDVVRRASGALSETEARRFLHRFLFSGDGALTPVRRLSYGERRRLALACMVLAGANLLILDEPTNHLDIPSREAFEAALDAYEGAILAVTHDRWFIERFAERVLRLEGGTLREI